MVGKPRSHVCGGVLGGGDDDAATLAVAEPDQTAGAGPAATHLLAGGSSSLAGVSSEGKEVAGCGARPDPAGAGAAATREWDAFNEPEDSALVASE